MSASLIEKAKLVNVDLSTEQAEALQIYLKELAAFNEHTNLVSRADADVVIDDHILDSLTLVPIIQRICHSEEASLIDIGSGAGFPGLILAVACPFLHITLVESVGKKCSFLSACGKSLGLEARLQVLNERAEELGHARGMREQFDFATARAVGKVDIIAEFCLPFLGKGGYLLSQKSKAQLTGELQTGKGAITVLGGRIEEILDVDNPATGKDFALMLVKKVDETPKKYPRAYGQMKKSGIKG